MFTTTRFPKFAAVVAFAIGLSGSVSASTTVNLDGDKSAISVTCQFYCEGWSWTRPDTTGMTGSQRHAANLAAFQPAPPDGSGTGAWSTTSPSVGVGLEPPPGSPDEDNIASLFMSTIPTPDPAVDKDSLTKLQNNIDYSGISTFILGDTSKYFWVFDASYLYVFRTFNESLGIEAAETQWFTFNKDEGGAPSNVGSSGTIQPIPLPATGWLMIGMLGVGAFAAHRKRKQKAA